MFSSRKSAAEIRPNATPTFVRSVHPQLAASPPAALLSV
jgi:hypothetical protein